MTTQFAPLEVKPGVSLGPFKLGAFVNDVLRQIREAFLPRQPEFDVVYSAESPLDTQVILRCKELGLQLRFEPRSQRLVCVEASNLSELPLSYQKSLFSGSAVAEDYVSSFIKVYRLFGPTYPGKYDPEVEHYVIKYQGLCIMFRIPQQFAETYEINDELPIELPDGSSPTLARLFVYSGFDLNVPVLPPLQETDKFAANPVRVFVRESGTVVEVGGRKNAIYLGASVQDVQTELGSPTEVYFKEDDKMLIHSPQTRGIRVDADAAGVSKVTFHTPEEKTGRNAGDEAVTSAACFNSSDYFYNYFDLGMDVLFDKESHCVKKIILHTNMPGHAEFAIYRKCAFVLHYNDSANDSPDADHVEGLAQGKPKSKVKLSRLHSRPRTPAAPITSESQWPEVEASLGSAGKPMVRDTGAVTNPFGATFLYAYDGVIFEVLKSGYIASVTLF